jgi:hypothetical protein
MTYCVAISVDAGMVFCSDSLTNAGMDQVSTYSKMFHFGIDGERQIVILCAGNLATSQATIKSDIKKDADVNLLNIETLEEAADYIGDISREQQEKRTIEGKNLRPVLSLAARSAVPSIGPTSSIRRGITSLPPRIRPIFKSARASTASQFWPAS